MKKFIDGFKQGIVDGGGAPPTVRGVLRVLISLGLLAILIYETVRIFG
jgi:hypothetical protein